MDTTSTITTASTFTTTAPRQRPSLRPIATLTAQNIAKGHRSPGARAEFAARWVKGLLDVEQRTTTLAAAVFGCSRGSVHIALTESTDAPVTPAELLAFHWERAPEADRDTFVRHHLLAVWDVVDRLTR
jgi:hypothetical protein